MHTQAINTNSTLVLDGLEDITKNICFRQKFSDISEMQAFRGIFWSVKESLFQSWLQTEPELR